MDILNLGSQENLGAPKATNARKSKKLKAAIGIGGLATLTGVGSTLAAQLTLNNGQTIEFGQGKAVTSACDNAEHGGGFTITPESKYYNRGAKKFRVVSYTVSGLNLTPQGTGYLDSPEYAAASGDYNQDDAIADHPGEYYDNDVAEDWVPTCDGVVIDFSAYSDDDTYNNNAAWGNIENPLYLVDASDVDGSWGKGLTNIAFKFDSTNDSYSTQASDYYGISGSLPWDVYSTDYWWLDSWTNVHSDHAKITFAFEPGYGVDANAITKITAETMPDFPAGYITNQQDNIYSDDWYN
jgi:hypothetical protein